MRKHSVNRIQKVAAHSRMEFESHTIDRNLLADEIREYLPTHEADILVRNFAITIDLFPRHCCGPASAHLRAQLGYGEIADGWFGDNRHQFLDVGATAIADVTIVDITADQYKSRRDANIPKIYIGPLEHPYYC